MRFKITVQEQRETTRRGEKWVKLADTGNEKDGGTLYGWVDATMVDTQTIEIYEQSVDDLDVKKLAIFLNTTPRKRTRKVKDAPGRRPEHE